MANRHWENFQFLIIREIQIETRMKNASHLLGWLLSERKEITSVGKDVE
jgi:hypothetical protein